MPQNNSYGKCSGGGSRIQNTFFPFFILFSPVNCRMIRGTRYVAQKGTSANSKKCDRIVQQVADRSKQKRKKKKYELRESSRPIFITSKKRQGANQSAPKVQTQNTRVRFHFARAPRIADSQPGLIPVLNNFPANGSRNRTATRIFTHSQPVFSHIRSHSYSHSSSRVLYMNESQ